MFIKSRNYDGCIQRVRIDVGTLERLAQVETLLTAGR